MNRMSRQMAVVSRWLGLREMQARKARAEEENAMANREQKGNREKRKPKKDKTKVVAAAPTAYAVSKKK
jgi:hypothetical protein